MLLWPPGSFSPGAGVRLEGVNGHDPTPGVESRFSAEVSTQTAPPIQPQSTPKSAHTEAA